MIDHGFERGRVILARLHYCSYYPSCHITCQFDDKQGVPTNDGTYHMVELAARLLSRIEGSWPRRSLNQDIHFPQFLFPTSSFENWLAKDMKVVKEDEKSQMRGTK